MSDTEAVFVPRRRRRRATLRLAIQLFLLAAIVTAAAAWLGIAQVAQTFDLQIREELAGRERGVAAAKAGLQQEVDQSLRRIDDYLRTEAPLLERLFLETPDLGDVAEPLMHLHGLDLFEILNSNGVVLSSGHRPERVNLDARELLGLPADRAVLHAAEREDGATAAAFVERHVLEFGRGRLMLVGGRWLGQELIDRAAEGGAVLLFGSDPAMPAIRSAAVTPPLVEAAKDWIIESDLAPGRSAAPATEEDRDREAPPGPAENPAPDSVQAEVPAGEPSSVEQVASTADEEGDAGPEPDPPANGNEETAETGDDPTTADRGATEAIVRGSDAGPEGTTLTGPDGSHWRAERIELVDWRGRSCGSLIFAVGRDRFDALLVRMRNSFLVLGSGVGLLAALVGVLLARRTTRPVDDLVLAFDAIAAGEADYTFEVRTGDELQELRAAFSRMHRALERQRLRSLAAERVAAWREVARHVAHEVKNPLAPIRTTVENLMRARRQAPERFDRMFGEGMETILEEVQQLSRIVGEFAEFARLPLPSPSHVDLDGLIERAVELYAAEPGVRIESTVDPRLPPVELDADQISRALKNVIGNAIEAVRDQAEQRERDPRVEIRATFEDEQAQIEICDNGPGFSEESSRRLFEPYFTTKETGTGLGMALAYRIVVEHGGVIFAENRASGGARVVIRLPLKAASPGEVASQREAYG